MKEFKVQPCEYILEKSKQNLNIFIETPSNPNYITIIATIKGGVALETQATKGFFEAYNFSMMNVLFQDQYLCKNIQIYDYDFDIVLKY